MQNLIASSTSATEEARRVMQTCNACRYCEGLCATFQAMTIRRDFASTDLDYLANLCHNCTACYHDCQFAPPHDFAINVPAALADLRLQSYQQHAWPESLSKAFNRNALWTAAVTTLSITISLLLAFLLISSETMFGVHQGPGAFYQVIGHSLMIAIAGMTFGFSLLAIGISFARFWKTHVKPPADSTHLTAALRNSVTLRYLDGGHGQGCSSVDDQASNLRRYYHHCTMWGFLLCFGATCIATFYDYVLGIQAPYPYFSLPVVVGTLGGLGLLVGPVGLVWNKFWSHSDTTRHQDMDLAFLASLFLVSLTGLILLIFRETAAMGVLLIIHLGFVLGFFLMLPYSKFVHGFYRYAALVRFASEEAR